ncbi:hypothetical protein EDB89DRAFT_1911013 [Lactarius sanguifluus]|nr:hypothetical protein EDB89DRAFT_1911013 [Lactarius sanguifluus]
MTTHDHDHDNRPRQPTTTTDHNDTRPRRHMTMTTHDHGNTRRQHDTTTTRHHDDTTTTRHDTMAMRFDNSDSLTPVTLAPSATKMGNVIGLLDITKVFHEARTRSSAVHPSEKLYSALAGVQSELGTGLGANPQTAAMFAYVEALREKTALPDLMTIKGSRTQCRGRPKSNRSRCRAPHARVIAGIFTSKDVVLRVIAAGLDASMCSVVRAPFSDPPMAAVLFWSLNGSASLSLHGGPEPVGASPPLQLTALPWTSTLAPPLPRTLLLGNLQDLNASGKSQNLWCNFEAFVIEDTQFVSMTRMFQIAHKRSQRANGLEVRDPD